jgi:hypothetical protein
MMGGARTAMEPTPLTCSKCGASWKLIKAGKGPVTCPQCKAALDGSPPALGRANPVPTAPAIAPSPAEVSDADDPGLRGGFVRSLPDPVPPRRRTNPLLRAMVILLLLLILVPLAAIVLFAVVCAVLVA